MRMLVVEDEPTLAAQLADALRHAGYTVDTAADGATAHYMGEVETYDVVVLDLGLPVMDGLTVLKQWRAGGQGMPVLILTARDALQDRVQGLDLGADDYMVKPFELPELLARLRALLRRSQAATTAVLGFGPLELDTANRQVGIRPAADAALVPIDLGPREWTVLEYLMIHAPKPASKDKLLQALTGWDKEITPNAVEVYVSRLRGKLEPHGVGLRSIRGFGYRLELLGA